VLVRDSMTTTVITVSPKTSVLNARRLMTGHGIRHLPVMERDRVVGIISDRDVRIADQELLDCLRTLQSDLVHGRYRSVGALMSRPVHTASPADTVATAARAMVARRIGALPVVEGGRLVGIISLSDCVRALVSTSPRPPSGADPVTPLGAPPAERGPRPAAPMPRAGMTARTP
jgi:acetoin utilization protein AcuB